MEIFISTNGILLNIHYFPSQYFFDLEDIIFEIFNNFENNMISVELAKVPTRVVGLAAPNKISIKFWNNVYNKSKAWQLLDFMNKPSMGFFFVLLLWLIVLRKNHTPYHFGWNLIKQERHWNYVECIVWRAIEESVINNTCSFIEWVQKLLTTWFECSHVIELEMHQSSSALAKDHENCCTSCL